MIRKSARIAGLLCAFIAGGCAAGHKPPVDLSQPGVTQEKHDADLADCRAQASSLSLSRKQANPMRSFGGAGNPNGNSAVTYYQNPDDVALISQPGGMQKFLDLCMQRKGYQLTN
jgi:hypothetical protein